MLSGQLELLYAPQRFSWARADIGNDLSDSWVALRGCKGSKAGRHELGASVYLTH
jgi:hypothetical protein